MKAKASRLFGVNTANFRVPSGTAPGYREKGHGGLSHVGSYGFSCSSSVSTTNGMYLDFRVTGLYPNLAGGRAYSFQLRCLSE